MWGRRIGAVSQPVDRPYATFQYDPEFVESGIQVSPIQMPLQRGPYEFPQLPYITFQGLPGLLADSLPDRFGNALINAWLVEQGRKSNSFTVLEKLAYMGSRSMGALEFKPAVNPALGKSVPVDVKHMVDLASEVLSGRRQLRTEFKEGHVDGALLDIMRVGTSAGGARAKAVIAWNPETGEVRSGQVRTAVEFEYWLIKFDGVEENRDKEVVDSKGYGALEYAYSLMAKQARITMSETRLLEEGGRRHFMTKRFDRLPGGGKLHMLSLCGLAHFDFNHAGGYSYEQALTILSQLGLGAEEKEEQFRRAVFNVVARNQDDHVKNIGYLMNKEGAWSLSPAYDMTFSFNPSGAWTSKHQMTVNGKAEGILRDDLLSCAEVGGVKRKTANDVIDEVCSAAKTWPQIANEVGIDEAVTKRIGDTFEFL